MKPRHTIPQLAKYFGVSRQAMNELLVKYRIPCHVVFTGFGAVRVYTLHHVKKLLALRMKRRRKVSRKL